MKPRAARVRMLMLVVLATLMLDQFSKYWLLYEFGMFARPPVVVTEWFSLVMWWNHGVSFGMLSDAANRYAPYVLMAVAIVISGVLSRLALQTECRFERVAYGLVVGGALGNALDRARYGAVADFLYFHVGEVGWPAFNIADSAICVGVFVLLIRMWRGSKVSS